MAASHGVPDIRLMSVRLLEPYERVMVDRKEILAVLSQQVTDEMIARHKRVDHKCREATVRLVRRAKREGIKLEHRAGFYGMTTHNWAYDPILDRIIDPTRSQFGRNRDGIQPISAAHSYEYIPKEVIEKHLGYVCQSRMYETWDRIKPLLDCGLPVDEYRGEDFVEQRYDKRGRTYWYFGCKVRFSVATSWEPKIRSALVFDNPVNIKIAILRQHRILVGDKFIYPTRQEIYFAAKNTGVLWRSVNGKWEGVYEISDIMCIVGDLLHHLGFPSSREAF